MSGHTNPMRTRLLAGVLAGSLALSALVLTASAASTAPLLKARTLTIHLTNRAGGMPIGGLALDGSRAGYVQGVPRSSCGLGLRVYRWDLATGRTSALSGRKTCGQPPTSSGDGIVQIALGSTHSSWLLNSGTNTESWERLFALGTIRGTDIVRATSERGQSSVATPCCSGSWIGGLVSDGSRLTYARWSTDANQKVTTSALWRWPISSSNPTKIARGTGAVIAASADAGRTALLRADGSVAVYGLEGGLLNTITGAAPSWCAPGGPGAARDPSEGIALTGDLVAVLTGTHSCAGQGDSIRVYNRKSGALLHTWPIGGAHSWTFDAYHGLAVYGSGTRVHVLDLDTGKSAVVANRSYAIAGARLDSAGLLYYLNGRWSPKSGQTGWLVFVPFNTVAAKARS